MYVYICIYIYMYISICIYLCMYTSIYLYIDICTFKTIFYTDVFADPLNVDTCICLNNGYCG